MDRSLNQYPPELVHSSDNFGSSVAFDEQVEFRFLLGFGLDTGRVEETCLSDQEALKSVGSMCDSETI